MSLRVMAKLTSLEFNNDKKEETMSYQQLAFPNVTTSNPIVHVKKLLSFMQNKITRYVT